MCFHGNGRFDPALLQSIERPLLVAGPSTPAVKPWPAPVLPTGGGTCHDVTMSPCHDVPVPARALQGVRSKARALCSQWTPTPLGWDPSSTSAAASCPCCKGGHWDIPEVSAALGAAVEVMAACAAGWHRVLQPPAPGW